MLLSGVSGSVDLDFSFDLSMDLIFFFFFMPSFFENFFENFFQNVAGLNVIIASYMLSFYFIGVSLTPLLLSLLGYLSRELYLESLLYLTLLLLFRSTLSYREFRELEFFRSFITTLILFQNWSSELVTFLFLVLMLSFFS